MPQIDRLLLIDDSDGFRDTAQAVLRPHCGEILVAENVEQGVHALHGERDLDLVISDVVLPDGDGFEVLRSVSAMPDEVRPAAILTTAKASPVGERIASRLGAIAYLAKPVAFRDVATAWQRRCGRDLVRDRVRAAPIGEALLCDSFGADEPLVRWDLRDLSPTGAFLITDGPLPLRRNLSLLLSVQGVKIPVFAQVARVQEPVWGLAAGVGVEFVGMDAETRWKLERIVGVRESSAFELERRGFPLA